MKSNKINSLSHPLPTSLHSKAHCECEVLEAEETSRNTQPLELQDGRTRHSRAGDFILTAFVICETWASQLALLASVHQ